ncbi:MAG: zinc ribbon domain-containing protein [Eggerthellaceae bacterium]|nr:zinc ribbon domain-containing protein [Eggerthellaceae bacterium]
MNCSNCGHENPDTNAFCEQCGTPLGAQTETSTTELPAEQKQDKPNMQAAEVKEPVDPQPGEAGSTAQDKPKRTRTLRIVAIALGALVVVGGALFAINTAQKASLPTVYGSFSDSRPVSDNHGRFLSFKVEQDAAPSNSTQHFAIISCEWVPGKYDLDGYEVELGSDHIDIVARVALQDGSDKVTFTPHETLSEGVDWQVSGSFGKGSVTLEEGYWTIETSKGMKVPVYVDHLTLPLGNAA